MADVSVFTHLIVGQGDTDVINTGGNRILVIRDVGHSLESVLVAHILDFVGDHIEFSIL